MNQDLYKFKNIYQPSDCLTEEQLLQYVRNELQGPALRTVEMHICDCPLCDTAVETLIAQGSEGFEAKLARVQAAVDSKTNTGKQEEKEEAKIIEFPRASSSNAPAASAPKRRNLVTFFSVAAAVTLLIAFAFIFMGGSLTPDEIAGKYFALEEYGGTRGSESSDSLFVAGVNFFKEKKYEEAANALSQVKDGEAAYYAGQSYYVLSKYAEAEKQFQKSVEMSKDRHGLYSEFNLALAYLKLNKVEEARATLTSITKNESHPYYTEAKSALEDLQNVKAE